MLQKAQKVYIRRNDEKQKSKAKLMVAMVDQVGKQQPKDEAGRGRLADRGRRVVQGRECNNFSNTLRKKMRSS